MASVREKLLSQGGGVISLVGAGGKTTLMFCLARELAEAGEKVLTTTTTKIFEPTKEQSAHLVVSTDIRDLTKKADALLSVHPHITAAQGHLVSEEKLVGFDPTEIQRIWETGLFPWILVEADGAAGKPLKAPAEHEPVIPACSSSVVAVVGLDGVGRPLNEQWVFRPELYSGITGLPMGSSVTEGSIACVIEHREGLMKGCPPRAERFVFLNKAEGGRACRAAREIGSLLSKSEAVRFEKIMIGALLSQPPIVECYGAEEGST